MIKITGLIVCVLAACLTKVSAVTEAERGALRNALQACFVDHGVKDGDIDNAKTAHNVDNIEACFLGCALKKVQLIDNNGRYTPENGIATLSKFFSSQEDITKFQITANNCLKVNDQPVGDGEAGCERAKLVINCAIEQKLEIPI